MRSILIFVLVGTWGNFSSARDDFSMVKERLQRRYEDFYLRIQEKKRNNLMRQSQAKSHKKRRQARARSYDNKRRQFVRKKIKDQKQQRLRYEKQLQKKVQARHRLRLKYIQQRELLKKIKERDWKISLEKETGLEEP